MPTELPRDTPAEYGAHLMATFKPATIWVMLCEAVERPDTIPDGWGWRVEVLRSVLVIYEVTSGERMTEDPSCWGLTGEALIDGMRVSARGGDYWDDNRAQIIERFEAHAERMRIERKIECEPDRESRRSVDTIAAQFRVLQRIGNRIDRVTVDPDRVMDVIRQRKDHLGWIASGTAGAGSTS